MSASTIPSYRLSPVGRNTWTYTGTDGRAGGRIRARGAAVEILDWHAPAHDEAPTVAALRELKVAWPGRVTVRDVSPDPGDAQRGTWLHLFGRGVVDVLADTEGRDVARRVPLADPLRWKGPKRAPGEAHDQRLDVSHGSGWGAEEDLVFDAALALDLPWRIDPVVVRYRIARDHPEARKVLAQAKEEWRDYLRVGLGHQYDNLQLAWEQGLQERLPPITIFETGRIFDGWHRVVAALGHGVDDVPAIVVRWSAR